MPGLCFGMPDIPVVDLMSLVGSFAMRTFDMGKIQATKDYQLAVNSPILVAIGTENDTPKAWLSAGQALGKILLQARAQRFGPLLKQPIEVPPIALPVTRRFGQNWISATAISHRLWFVSQGYTATHGKRGTA